MKRKMARRGLPKHPPPSSTRGEGRFGRPEAQNERRNAGASQTTCSWKGVHAVPMNEQLVPLRLPGAAVRGGTTFQADGRAQPQRNAPDYAKGCCAALASRHPSPMLTRGYRRMAARVHSTGAKQTVPVAAGAVMVVASCTRAPGSGCTAKPGWRCHNTGQFTALRQRDPDAPPRQHTPLQRARAADLR